MSSDRGSQCLLCDEIPFSNRLVCEWEDAYVISDAYPVVPGHLLIVLKQHKLAFADLDDKPLGRIKDQIRKLSKKLTHLNPTVLAFERGNVLENTSGNPSVDHAHIHLVPSPDLESCLPSATQRGHIEDFSKLREKGNYYLYWNTADRDICYGSGWLVPSQFIRRAVSRVNNVERWNWREPGAWHLSAADNRQIVIDLLI